MESTTSSPKQRRKRLASDQEFLKKLIATLSKEICTKEQLAEKMGLATKKITDSVLLAAIRLQGDSIFMDNLIEKRPAAKARKGAIFSTKRGLVIPAWMFDGKQVVDQQKYIVEFGRKGLVHLRPRDEVDSKRE